MLSTTQAKLLKTLLMQRAQSRGFVLLTVISITIVILAILGAYSTLTTIDQNVSLSTQDSNNGFFAAEAGLNVRADTVRTIFQGFNRPSGTSPTGATPCLGGNTGSGDFQCITYDISNFDVSTYVTEDAANPRAVVIPSGEDFAGLNAQEYRYSAIAQATRLDNQPQAILEMVFQSRLVPLFQFAVFYDNDLEIFPGPRMELAGPIHTNSNLYLGAVDGLTIDGSITSGLDFFMGRKHQNSDGGICGTNTFSPPAPGRTVNLLGNNTALLCNGTRVQYNDANINNVGATNVITPRRDPLEVPGNSNFAPVAGNEYFALADLRLALNIRNPAAPRIEVRNSDTTVNPGLTAALNSPACSAPAPSSNQADPRDPAYIPQYDRSAVSYLPSPATLNGGTWNGNENTNQGQLNTLVRNWSFDTAAPGNPVREPVDVDDPGFPPFYDHRERRFIEMFNINVQRLLDCIDANNALTGGEPLNTTGEGGLVFHISVDGPNSGGLNNYGIRLVGGEQLTTTSGTPGGDCAATGEPCGLTIVSDQSVYVQGNYNAPDNEMAGTWDPVGGQPNRIPASVIADTISILSNNWDDRRSFNLGFTNTGTGGNSSSPFGNNFRNGRLARDTEFNIAILGGTESSCGAELVTCNAAYNGGFENFPRFLERWGNAVQMRYRGSIVSLENPATKNTLLGTRGGFYAAPSRLWAFDTRFRRAENLPPLSPRFIYLVQELFVREFEQ